MIITRFAPSPTGMLHIGGARTALFNYLYSKNKKGKFLLRIEDTDKQRSTKEATQEILDSLAWLGINYDDEIYYQSQREKRHREVALSLLEQGKAYYCYRSKEELDLLRGQKTNEKLKYNRDSADKNNTNILPSIRLKTPLSGMTEFNDQILGNIKIANEEQDDFVILRSDGTPTYMLAVVVDDHDMAITDIMRGGDHLTNCAKQILLYNALGWEKPSFAHIPLIHAADGSKMSKRHGAVAVSEYKKQGYLPKAMRNYLLRLGFSHGDDEIISDEQAISWFNISNIGKSAAKFDEKKLNNLNAYYLRNMADEKLIDFITNNEKFSTMELSRLKKILPELKIRAVTLNELKENSQFLREGFTAELTIKAQKSIDNNQEIIPQIIEFIAKQQDFNHDLLYQNSKDFAEKNNIKLKNFAAILRAALTRSHISAGIFEIAEILGKEEVIKRLYQLNT